MTVSISYTVHRLNILNRRYRLMGFCIRQHTDLYSNCSLILHELWFFNFFNGSIRILIETMTRCLLRKFILLLIKNENEIVGGAFFQFSVVHSISFCIHPTDKIKVDNHKKTWREKNISLHNETGGRWGWNKKKTKRLYRNIQMHKDYIIGWWKTVRERKEIHHLMKSTSIIFDIFNKYASKYIHTHTQWVIHRTTTRYIPT